MMQDVGAVGKLSVFSLWEEGCERERADGGYVKGGVEGRKWARKRITTAATTPGR